MFTAVPRRLFALVSDFRDKAQMSISAMFAVAAGLVVLAATIGVLGGVTEDVTRHNGMSSSDAARLRWFIDHRPQALVSAARVVSQLASPMALAVLAVVAAGLLWFRGQRLLIAVAPAVAFGLAGLGAFAGKVMVGRNRPPVPLHLVVESDPSFPSGHATESTAFLISFALLVAVFVLRKPLARAVIIGAASLGSFTVGAGRLVLGVHWPSDVIAGWALGLSVALIVTLVASLAVRIVPNRPAPTRPLLARAVRCLTAVRGSRSLQAA